MTATTESASVSGDETVEQLKALNVFMVGCGAIGCEMLKNLALIGAACGPRGILQLTDDDNIEKRYKKNVGKSFILNLNVKMIENVFKPLSK